MNTNDFNIILYMPISGPKKHVTRNVSMPFVPTKGTYIHFDKNRENFVVVDETHYSVINKVIYCTVHYESILSYDTILSLGWESW